MSMYFKPYEGKRPFLFVSYAHKQSEAVVNTIRIIHDKDYRVWYDEGIPAGNDWPSNIASHMECCEGVLFFLSKRALESHNCFSEMKEAYRQEKKILVIRLDKTPMTDNWEEILKDCQVIPLIEDNEKRADAILGSGFITPRFQITIWEKLPWKMMGLAASLLFFTGTATFAGVIAGGYWTPYTEEETVTEAPVQEEALSSAPVLADLGDSEGLFGIEFPDKQQERAIRRILNIPEGGISARQLSDIKEIYYCGGLSVSDPEDIRFSADGECLVNDVPVVTGQVTDLSLFRYMVYLEKLSLICQPVEDLSGIDGLSNLRELSLAGCELDEIRGLHDLQGLEIIHLEHTDIRDLTSLEEMPRLRTVTVSRDMLPLTWNDDAKFEVVLINES